MRILWQFEQVKFESLWKGLKMKLEFDFYEKDDCLTGLSLEIDGNDYVNITSRYG